ncbi:MAG: EAL domain-containing protein [Steroidobacteraceae bacterium]
MNKPPQTLESWSDVPSPVGATSLDPYGQLIRMLMPRALSITICDRTGLPIWLSDGIDSTDLQQYVHEALSDPAYEASRGDAWTESLDNERVIHVFLLRDPGGALLGCVGIVCSESGTAAAARSATLVQGLLRPALECLQRELASQSNIVELQRSLLNRDLDLELLLRGGGCATASESPDDFAQIVQGCVDHLGCTVGALIIPDKNIAVCRTGAGTPVRTGAETLTRAHRPLLAWTQLHRQVMVANAPVEDGSTGGLSGKVLSCPVMHGAQRVLGLLAMFRSAEAPDFGLREVRLVELLARRVAYVTLNAYDPNTGLLTRPAFEKRALATLTPEAMRNPNSVVYLDIDRMHVVNENHGMHVGDEIIVRVAEVIRQSLAPRSLAARISGDRFALLLPGTTLDAAQEAAAGLCERIAGMGFLAAGQPVEITASLGVAPVGEGEHPLPHALAAAEVACKAAKDRGRGRVERYEDSDHSIIRRYTDVTLVGALRSALAEGRFRLDAQPIVPLNGPSTGPKYELLLRMLDERGESVAPDKFLSAAERYQLAPSVDRWVVQHVLRALDPVARQLAGFGASFAVNISGQSLGDQEFADFLQFELRSSGIAPSLLSFELTETAAVANIVRAETLIRRLRDLGFGVALDDFGRGLSSLTYLKALPVTTLKVDGSLVRDVAGDDRSQAMLSAIVRLAQAIGLETVAECVESNEILLITRNLGVGFGQGFSIGRPVPLDRVLTGLVGARIEPGLPVARSA